MGEKKPFTFTAVIYMEDKTGGGSVCCGEEIIFAQTMSAKENYSFRPVERNVFLPEEELMKADQKRMEQAGKVLSEYLSHNRK